MGKVTPAVTRSLLTNVDSLKSMQKCYNGRSKRNKLLVDLCLVRLISFRQISLHSFSGQMVLGVNPDIYLPIIF